jgi:UPF0755 protein
MSESETESSIPSNRRRKIVRAFVLFGTLFLIMVAAIGAGAYLFYQHVTEPREATGSLEFIVVEGVSGSEIAIKLAREEFIEHPLFFRLALKLDKTPGVIKHGIYELPVGVSPLQLLDELQRQTPAPILSNTFKVTLPEGLTLQQMAAQFDDPQAFLDAANALNTFELFGVDVGTPEGFLMPNTYYFDDPPSPDEVVERMAQEFRKTLEKIKSDFPEMNERDLVEVVTIASLIEEEARKDDERPLVAGVIYNRLEKGMALEMDSTLQYALKKYGERLLSSDTEVDSPYNTYRRKGLPPGPISNPGEASLRAAINPADVEYLFFVSNADGESHTFSKTLKEHNRAVAKYRKAMREQRRNQ